MNRQQSAWQHRNAYLDGLEDHRLETVLLDGRSRIDASNVITVILTVLCIIAIVVLM